MKRLILFIIASIFLASVVFGASIPLKFDWTPNTEPDMAGYNLYNQFGKVNTTLIPHPPIFPYNTTLVVPDGSEGVANFFLTAVDTAGNESGPSNTVTYPFDFKPPAAPGGLRRIP